MIEVNAFIDGFMLGCGVIAATAGTIFLIVGGIRLIRKARS